MGVLSNLLINNVEINLYVVSIIHTHLLTLTFKLKLHLTVLSAHAFMFKLHFTSTFRHISLKRRTSQRTLIRRQPFVRN